MEQSRAIAGAVVVVYNKLCGDSLTCRALAEMGKNAPRVLIYDNSTTDVVQKNREFCREHGWQYLGGTGNVGLSRAYNACIDALRGQQGVMCLFDDDTALDGEYFESLRRGLARTDAGILVPMIYTGERLISPCIRLPDRRCRLFQNEQALRGYTGDALTAINSCMAIDLSVFSQYRYDENIFLDGIDHTFLEDQKALGRKIFILDYRCTHGFSGMEKPPMRAALTRFRILAKDFRYILRNEPGSYRKLIGRRMLHLTLQYRSLSFFREYMKITHPI